MKAQAIHPSKSILTLTMEFLKLPRRNNNLMGQEVYAEQFDNPGESEHTINISEQSEGLYFLNMNIDGAISSKKIINYMPK